MFYNHFHLKLNLEKSLLCKWKILHPTIDSMFRAPYDRILEILFKKAINDGNGNTTCVFSLVKLMKKKCYWTSYNIDNVKGTFGLRCSLGSESNHNGVKILYHRI